MSCAALDVCGHVAELLLGVVVPEHETVLAELLLGLVVQAAVVQIALLGVREESLGLGAPELCLNPVGAYDQGDSYADRELHRGSDAGRFC